MKKVLLLLLICASFASAFAQANFYDLYKIQDVKIEFGYPDWEAKLHAEKADKQNYIIAKSCTINGVKFDSVGVKFKGNSTYKKDNKKNPLHIKLNVVKSQDYNGIKSIKLNNIFSDPSYVREVLSYQILRNYMAASEANFAKVFIDGNYYGFMTNVEPVGNGFVSKHFNSSENVFVKCTPSLPGGAPGGGGPPIGGPPTGSAACNLKFTNYDSTSTAHKGVYEMENGYGWKAFISLMDTLKNNPTKTDKILDIDKAIWMHAFNNVLVNLDSYTGLLSQNYYMYQNDNQQFMPIMWDFNMSFGSFTSTGETAGGLPTGGEDLSVMKTKLHFDNDERPMIKVIMANPTYRRMYFAHCKTILEEFFANNAYLTEANKVRNFIDTEVKNDVNPFYPYAKFQDGLTAPQPAAGSPGSPATDFIGIKTLMDKRVAFLQSQPEFKAFAPTIAEVNYAPKTALKGEKVWVTAKISSNTNAFVAYREDSEDIFEKIQLFDDGKHQDGAANDGTFGAELVARDFKMQYYVYAENADAGLFAPQRAEHEFFTLILQNAGQSNVKLGDLVINEFQASNKATAKDPSDDKYDDWAELYNTTNAEIVLDNLYFTDDFTKKDKFQFPNGVKIAAKSRIIVWLDEDSKATTGVHANFKLSGSGEQLWLGKADGTVLDSITFKGMKDDQVMARCPEGTGEFIVTSPTFNASNGNCKPLANKELELSEAKIYPNPTQGILNIVSENAIGKIQVFNLSGQVIFQVIKEDNNTTIDLSDLAKGMYFVKIDNTKVMKVILSE
jgi:CotH kinase protein/Secretion system C-terminal sorting domain/Lamin Tail Domain